MFSKREFLSLVDKYYRQSKSVDLSDEFFRLHENEINLCQSYVLEDDLSYEREDYIVTTRDMISISIELIYLMIKEENLLDDDVEDGVRDPEVRSERDQIYLLEEMLCILGDLGNIGFVRSILSCIGISVYGRDNLELLKKDEETLARNFESDMRDVKLLLVQRVQMMGLVASLIESYLDSKFDHLKSRESTKQLMSEVFDCMLEIDREICQKLNWEAMEITNRQELSLEFLSNTGKRITEYFI